MIYGPMMDEVFVSYQKQHDLAGWYVKSDGSSHQHPDSAFNPSVLFDSLIEIPLH
jgi:hypothetical protein